MSNIKMYEILFLVEFPVSKEFHVALQIIKCTFVNDTYLNNKKVLQL